MTWYLRPMTLLPLSVTPRPVYHRRRGDSQDRQRLQLSAGLIRASTSRYGRPLLASGSRGRPRARSPITFLLISSLPPAIDMHRTKLNCSEYRPPSTPSSPH